MGNQQKQLVVCPEDLNKQIEQLEQENHSLKLEILLLKQDLHNLRCKFLNQESELFHYQLKARTINGWRTKQLGTERKTGTTNT